ncbi:DUF6901 family protein [Elusimicrobiota bacterium]
MEEKIVRYYYNFKFKDGSVHNSVLHLSSNRIKLVKDGTEEEMKKPDWARLKYFQCENCILDEEVHKYCPVTVNLIDVIDTFKDVESTEIVEVTVKTPEREFYSKVAVQKAISSLMGIYMGISDCPILGKFAPMARFHLPFSTVEETMYRTISNYLLAQYYIDEEGLKPDWKLDGLKKFYDEVAKVNTALCERVRSVSARDANVNAVIFLDNFAKNITFLIDVVLKKIKPIFQKYIDDARE